MTPIEGSLVITLAICVIWWMVDHLLMADQIKKAAERVSFLEQRLNFKNQELDLWMCNE